MFTRKQDKTCGLAISKNWTFEYERKMSYQKMRLFSYAYLNDISKYFGLNFKFYLCRVMNGVVTQYNESAERQLILSRMRETLTKKSNIRLLDSMTRKIREDFDSFVKHVESIPNDFSLCSSADLQKVYDKYVKAEHDISLAVQLLFGPIEEAIINAFSEALKQKFSDTEAKKILSTCAIPAVITPVERYELDLCESVISGEPKQKMIDKLAAKYSHKGMFDCIYEYFSRGELEKNLARIDKRYALSYLKKIKSKYAAHTIEINNIRKKLLDDRYLFALFNLYTTYAIYKEWKPIYREYSSVKLRKLLEAISKKISCTLEEAAFMTEEELKQSLKKEKIIVNNINERIKDSIYLFFMDELIIIAEKDLLGKFDKVLKLKDINELKGQCTCPGKAVGKAKIVLSSHDFSKMKAGDIIITPTTRSDFVPMLKIAGAIVTNEGGLLSHAAIISRELNKPCVIGTRIATQIFKDGDLIEVDANNGIVRKV